VKAYDREQTKLLSTGTLLTIDNQIDVTTGTVKIKAVFNNKNDSLFANQFVNIQLLVNTLKNATVIPTAAIQYGAKDPFVYLVNSDKTVTAKPVLLGVTMGNDTCITQGISPGQSVVTEGADKLTDGATVIVENTKTARETA
jgi:multidrug efflux system membrane fusion protein